MHDVADNRGRRRGLRGWAGLAAGAALLAGAVLALMQGYTPPGAAGADRYPDPYAVADGCFPEFK